MFWEGDGAWYRGTVSGYSAATQRHTVLYDDNDLERVVLDAVPHRCASLSLSRIRCKWDLLRVVLLTTPSVWCWMLCSTGVPLSLTLWFASTRSF